VNEHSEKFVQHLISLGTHDRGALAVLRHSLAFEPGTYPKAFPYVERFVSASSHERDARRLALYAVAALYARHPRHQEQSFASAFGVLFRKRESLGIEGRFVALLGADAENIFDYLRQAIGVLASDDIGLNYLILLGDLSRWMNSKTNADRLRQRWARDFYSVVHIEAISEANIETNQASVL
jgi:CRISPR system Cascade subunit CasB